MTYTAAATTSLVSFTHTSLTCSLTSAGQKFAAVTLAGTGGTVQQQDDFLCNNVVNAVWTLTAGTWDCNSHAFTATEFKSNNSNARTFSAGSALNIGGNAGSNQTIWDVTTATSFTFTKNALSNITVLANTVSTTGFNITGMAASLNLPGLTFITQSFPGMAVINLGGTWTSLTVGAGWSIVAPQASAAMTVPTVAFNGTASNPCGFFVIAASSIIQLTCSTSFQATYTGIGFVAMTGAPATNSASNCFPFGINSGIIFNSSLVSPTALPTLIWQDPLASSDFTTAGSVGALMAGMSNLQYTVPAIGRGTVGSSASTTSIPTSAYAPATSASVANQLVGGVVYFDATTTTVALRGQRAVITASSASATPTLTVAALTAAPASGDTFSVV
jgi:hypothetical protein